MAHSGEMTPRLLYFVSARKAERMELTEPDCTVSWQFWRPSLTSIIPPGNPVWPFVVWWAFHVLRVFQSLDYCVVLCFENGTLAHRSCVFPRFYRFPFMGRDDLQVGDIWTAPGSRKKGLARLALAKAIEHFPARRIWYVCDEANLASIAVAKNAGMLLHAIGTRTRRFGFRLFGQFRILSLVKERIVS